ncbi:hypothetical protein E0H93_36555 [Rhizobium leguminosarum bv. viciae]|uniref:hypothetical protein n=1 Tax=Rhizobium leguminosarum TaxID=384 RepID=UPI00103D8E4B|nr:hypothetical protein [Rhizobium leguminosarum]TBY18518.1 hypothetical protein E0H55_37040 [Rhizobium leguminosarum bv. viciae]TCA92996.1 hypothetical protein E0H93_36555 [Rhizobium leguminosarum bv. viciae]
MSKKIEQDYLDAIERLLRGGATHPELARKRAKAPVNFSTVAKEARRSRTAIATEGTAYPAVRAAILKIARPISNDMMRPLPDSVRSTSLQVHLLNERKNRILAENAARVLATKLAAAEVHAHTLQAQIDSLERKMQRSSELPKPRNTGRRPPQ